MKQGLEEKWMEKKALKNRGKWFKPKVLVEKQPITAKGDPRGAVSSSQCGWSYDGSFAAFLRPTLSLCLPLVFITAVMMLRGQARPTVA